MLQLPAIGITLLGGLATYIGARLASGATSTTRPELQPIPIPVAPTIPKPVVKAPVKEPVAAPVEHTAPPPAPTPPVDKSPGLPTPPVPPPVVIAPPVVAPPKVTTGPAVVEPPPVAVETKPPPAAPPPPVDVSPALPTPVVQPPVVLPPVRPDADVPIIEVSARDKPPAGFDAAIASTLAPGVAKDIKSKQYNFDREALERFQLAAGLDADGVYGNDSWGALLYFTSDAPKALYKPSTPTPYKWGQWVMLSALNDAPRGPNAIVEPTPVDLEQTQPPAAASPMDIGPVPPSGFNPTSARKLAKQVAANIDSKAKLYSRDLLKQFQTAAGLVSDGLYGGSSRRALIFYGVPRPAQPLFKPTATPAEYLWAKQAGGGS